MNDTISAPLPGADERTTLSVDTPKYRGFTQDEVLDKLGMAVTEGKVPHDLGDVAARALESRDGNDAALIMRLVGGISYEATSTPPFSPNEDPRLTRNAVNKILMRAGVRTILPPRNSGVDVKDLLNAVAEASEDRRVFDEQAGTPLADQPAPIGHTPRHRRRLLNR